MGNDCFRSRKYVIMSVDPNQYISILEIIKEQNDRRLERTLKVVGVNAKKIVNFKNEYGISLLMQACFFTNPKIVEILLNYGAEIDDEDNEGRTALFYTFSPENPRKLFILEKLIEHKCNIEHEDKHGNTFLHLLIRARETDIIKILVKNGADIEKVDIDGVSPLLRAVDTQNHQLVSYLCSKHANVNFVDGIYKWGALHIATIHNDVQIMRTLIHHGADVNKVDTLNKTALTYSRENFYDEAMKCLLKANAKDSRRTYKPRLSVTFAHTHVTFGDIIKEDK